MPPPSSPVPCLSSVLSAVLTVHTIASRSPLRHTSPPIDQQPQGSASTVCHPARLVPASLPIRQVVRVGQRASQGGRSLASHPAAPLHPAGVPRHICGHLRRRGGVYQAISGRRGCSARKFVSGFFARLYRSKYQLFNFSEGLSRAKPVHRGNGNCT